MVSYYIIKKFDEKFQVSKNLSNEGGIKYPFLRKNRQKKLYNF